MVSAARCTISSFAGEIQRATALVAVVEAEAERAHRALTRLQRQFPDRDLLDLTGTVQSLGKPVASDLREGKVSPQSARRDYGPPKSSQGS